MSEESSPAAEVNNTELVQLLNHKRVEIGEFFDTMKQQKEALQSTASAIADRLSLALQAEQLETADLQAMMAECSQVNLQQTMDEFAQLRASIQTAFSGYKTVMCANNELAAKVFEAIQTSQPMIEQVKALMAEFTSELENVQNVLGRLGA